ncbi:unnamed protein product [Heligmosomoides polygyrus]|uniref:Cx9C motif-containing protein 4, mitochondrial n=1 Tax=Heligmosomoides polygyrus TaxID=6339 RepID=A0A183GEP6_HELPZ|nr:unnamed protein product [Heligmosomoides polygyrus]
MPKPGTKFQPAFSKIELTTAEAFSTADPFGHAVGEQRKAEKEKARKTLISRSKAKDVEHPLCKFYCDMFELCIQNEDLRPICGKPIGCLC